MKAVPRESIELAHAQFLTLAATQMGRGRYSRLVNRKYILNKKNTYYLHQVDMTICPEYKNGRNGWRQKFMGLTLSRRNASMKMVHDFMSEHRRLR